MVFRDSQNGPSKLFERFWFWQDMQSPDAQKHGFLSRGCWGVQSRRTYWLAITAKGVDQDDA